VIHKYSEEDLFNTYVKTFFRRNILGGLKGFYFPINTTEWIIHARYLLTVIEEEHITSLFELGNSRDDKYYQSTASWIAGLLKRQEHFEQIGEYALRGGNKYWNGVFYASLLLFDHENAFRYYLEYLQKNTESLSKEYNDSGPLVVYALRIYDRKYNTKYSHPYSELAVSRKDENIINTILNFSDILRGGIEFKDFSELQTGLRVLLEQTVSPIQYTYGLLNHQPIRVQDLIPVSNKTPLPIAEENEVVENELILLTTKYLSKTSQAETVAELKAKVAIIKDPRDILSSLELDIFYKLPGAIVKVYFEKLFTLINSSYQLFELNAIHLLLRGKENDSEALALYDQAQKIKEGITWIEDNDYKYPMIRKAKSST
jgi:hypothetical protein